MTGPEHYTASEELLRVAAARLAGRVGVPDAEVALVLAEAQVHATLFAGAAAALPGLDIGPGLRAAWIRAICNDSPREDT